MVTEGHFGGEKCLKPLKCNKCRKHQNLMIDFPLTTLTLDLITNTTIFVVFG